MRLGQVVMRDVDSGATGEACQQVAGSGFLRVSPDSGQKDSLEGASMGWV